MLSACDSLQEFLHSKGQKQTYTYRVRLHRRALGPHIIGMSRVQKVSMLDVVVDKEKILFTKRCLHDIDAKDIMILWCLALKKSKKGEVSTWLIDTLRCFMTRETAVRSNNKHMMCVTKIKGKTVCNAFFALAIGYSRRGLN